MGLVFDRIRAKVTRAKQHIQDFQLGLISFQGSRPYRIGLKEDASTGKRTYYVAELREVPLELTAIAADVLQNLRSALDHIAYQLVLDSRAGTEPDWLVYYPITPTASDYPSRRTGTIKSIRQDAIDAIDATEPYKGGKGHGLWQLNALNKVDKHQLLIAAASFHQAVDLSGFFKRGLRELGNDRAAQIVPGIFLPVADKLLGLKVGDELYSEPLSLKKPEVDEHPNFAFGVSINAPGIVECEPAIKTLQDLTNLIDGVVASFEQFFP